MSSGRFSFLQVKGFGDLTIAASQLRWVEPHLIKSCSLLITPHLVDLANFLSPLFDVKVLGIEESSVPALYDIKKRGLLPAISSAFSMRQLLRLADTDSVLVMPDSSFRERFIAGRRSYLSIPRSDNIYNAHRQFLESELGVIKPVVVAKMVAESMRNRVAICPYSRIPDKNIPFELVGKLADACINFGFAPEILLLEGETVAQTIQGLSVRTVPRSFFELGTAISEYSCIISADSLPGHLAEYFQTPVFVAKRATNTYWLPLSAYEGQCWGVFDEYLNMKFRLQHFLDKVRSG